MRLQAKSLALFVGRFGTDRIAATIKVSGDRQAGLSSGRSNEVQNFLMAVERSARPI